MFTFKLFLLLLLVIEERSKIYYIGEKVMTLCQLKSKKQFKILKTTVCNII